MKTKMTKAIYATVLMLFFTGSMFAQSVGINDNNSSPNSKAMLDVSSTTKGFLPPRMTYSEKIAIASPPAGLIVWCSNCGTSGELQIYNGTIWTSLTAGTASGLPGAPTMGTATAGIAAASVTFSAPGSNGGSAITLYTATSNPGGFTGTSATAGTITVTGLTNGTAYTFTVTATNTTGTGAASAASNSVTPVSPVVGGSFQGGIIFYIFVSGDPGYVAGQTHGLIAALSDQSISVTWYNTVNTTTGATGTALGTGSANTTAIIASQGNTGTYAAKLCRDYAGGGYNDWYLPSKDELNKLYLNKAKVGGFDADTYWSSTEYTISGAWVHYFVNGNQNMGNKKVYYHVRAIRAF